MHVAVSHVGQHASPAVVRSCQAESASVTQSRLALRSPLEEAHTQGSRGPLDESMALVRKIDSEAKAIMVVMEGRFKCAYIAAYMGIDASYVSKFRSGARMMDDAQVAAFCRATGSNLLRQVRNLIETLEGGAKSEIRRLASELRSAA